MAKVKVYINRPELTELLNQATREICKPHADNVASRCGDGYKSDMKDFGTGRRSRSIASVFTSDPSAMRDNSKNNTILRNLQ